MHSVLAVYNEDSIVVVSLVVRFFHEHFVFVLGRSQYRYFIAIKSHIFKQRYSFHSFATDLRSTFVLFDLQ